MIKEMHTQTLISYNNEHFQNIFFVVDIATSLYVKWFHENMAYVSITKCLDYMLLVTMEEIIFLQVSVGYL